MCNLYTDFCKCCGAPIPMHLGDYETNPIEVAVICKDCLKEKTYKIRKHEWKASHAQDSGYKQQRHTIWKCGGDKQDKKLGKVVVVSLTDNAWKNAHMNHPNVEDPKLVKKIPPDKGVNEHESKRSK